MVNKFLITERNLLSLIGKLYLMKENDSDDYSVHDYYSDLDMHDIFIKVFRKWMVEKIGEKSLDLPLTYMLKRYGKEFLELIGETGDKELNDYNIRRIIKNAIKRGTIKVPSVRPKIKFTEKFRKAIDFLIGRLELPNYIQIEIQEPSPYNLRIETIVDYPEFLKDENKKSTTRYVDNFVRSLKDTLGIVEGEPYLGEIKIDRPNPKFQNLEGWVKTELKNIKNYIKTIDTGKNIHRIKFEPKDYKGELTVVFRDYASYLVKGQLKDKLKEYLKELGYKNITVES
jgi:hypothetical protein